MERQRNVGHETVCLVLQGAQAHQVVGAILVILSVAVQHGAVGAQSQLMGDKGRLQP